MMRIRRFRSVWALALVLATFCQEMKADDAATLVSLSTEFEAARVSGDVQAAKRLTMSDAQWITESATETSLILSDIEATSRRLAEGKGGKSDSFVAERNVEIHGDSAIVTELVRVGKRPPGPPIRRSVFWVRDAETWKIAHVHMSPYLRWESAISDFETADQAAPPKPGGVVFIGSSSIRRWETLAEDFPDARVLKRGFGGSQMIDSVLYAKRIVTPYAPVAVVVYEGDNDIGKGKDANRVFADFKNFVDAIQDELPGTKIAFISIKPSLKRWSSWPEIKRANQLIQDFAANHATIEYLDIATPMLGDDGMPRKELFVSDGLHLTKQGYAVWTEVIRPWVDNVATP